MNIEQAQALAMICHYAKEYLKDNKTMSQSVDIAQDIIKKELKALEIIVNKSVNTRNLIIYCFEMKDTYKDYVEMFNYCGNYWELGKEVLTQEEFDLLKEVLL